MSLTAPAHEMIRPVRVNTVVPSVSTFRGSKDRPYAAVLATVWVPNSSVVALSLSFTTTDTGMTSRSVELGLSSA